MNIQKIYSQTIGRTPTPEDVALVAERDAAKEESSGRTQIKINWLNSTVTQELLTKLAAERKELIDSAIQLSCNYHTHQNHFEIIRNLIKADQIQQVIEKTHL